MSSERIEDISIEQLTQSVSQLIAQTYIMVGYQTYNERDIGILAAKLSSDLRESYAYLTFPEVSLCFELGAKGTFGDYTGVNLRTFARWLKSYKTSDLRYHAVVERERERRQNALPSARLTRKSVSLPFSARYSSNTRPVTRWNAFIPPVSTSPCKSGD